MKFCITNTWYEESNEKKSKDRACEFGSRKKSGKAKARASATTNAKKKKNIHPCECLFHDIQGAKEMNINSE